MPMGARHDDDSGVLECVWYLDDGGHGDVIRLVEELVVGEEVVALLTEVLVILCMSYTYTTADVGQPPMTKRRRHTCNKSVRPVSSTMASVNECMELLRYDRPCPSSAGTSSRCGGRAWWRPRRRRGPRPSCHRAAAAASSHHRQHGRRRGRGRPPSAPASPGPSRPAWHPHGVVNDKLVVCMMMCDEDEGWVGDGVETVHLAT